MRDFIDFCLLILQKIVGCWFGLDLGKYSFGDFLVGILVVSVFISCLVISFIGIPSATSCGETEETWISTSTKT